MRTFLRMPLLLLLSFSTGAEIQFNRAREPIERLPPAAFLNLPATVRKDLVRRQCSVPQLAGFSQHSNVVSGHFVNRTGTDWAVLCSNGKSSVVLVFIGGRTEEVDSLARSDDKSWLADRMYSRIISVASASRVREAWEPSEGKALHPKRMHDAVEDSFEGKVSSLYYRVKPGTWVTLGGAD